MKYLDSVVALIAFGLSSVITASLFAGFAYWAFEGLGTMQREIVATAVAAPHRPPTGSAVAAAAAAGLPVVHYEPVTVIGHRSEGEAFASASAPNLR